MKRDTSDSSGVELGTQALSGNGFNQNGFVDQLRQNIAFRVQSMTSVLMGVSTSDGMSPVERRQNLQQNRRQLLGQMPGPFGGDMGDDDSGGSSRSQSTRSGSRGSGQIGRTGTSPSSSDMDTVEASVPSMSNVSRGTKERADDRGFGY